MNDFVEDIYASLNGDALPEVAIRWVENMFAEGKRCSVLYGEVYEANIRLCERLGVLDEDEDVERIISNLLEMQNILCEKMFYCGYRVGRGIDRM